MVLANGKSAPLVYQHQDILSGLQVEVFDHLIDVAFNASTVSGCRSIPDPQPRLSFAACKVIAWPLSGQNGFCNVYEG